MRDFAPKDMIVRERVISQIKSIFERYGYNPLETPVIERYDILTAKFAAGDTSDIVKEIFRLKDQGERDLGLRFDLTVPFARFVGMNPEMKMPFKRYQVGTVYRDGPIKLGRYREFIQCDADIVGTKAMLAEAELLRLGLDVFDALGLDAYIEVNNRKVLFGLMDGIGIPKDQFIPVITALDKIKKIGVDDVKKEIADLGIDDKKIDELMGLFEDATLDDFEKTITLLEKNITAETGKQGLAELKELFSYVNDKKIKLNIFLARGLGYYTGTVFEAFLLDSDVTSSIAGGGRYDEMISDYLGANREFPAVGISFGIEPITCAMSSTGKDKKSSVVKVYIIPIKTPNDSLDIASRLRKAGINCDIDLSGRSISKNLAFANFYRIPFVIIVGPDELSKGIVKLRDMTSGNEEEIELKKIESIKERL